MTSYFTHPLQPGMSLTCAVQWEGACWERAIAAAGGFGSLLAQPPFARLTNKSTAHSGYDNAVTEGYSKKLCRQLSNVEVAVSGIHGVVACMQALPMWF